MSRAKQIADRATQPFTNPAQTVRVFVDSLQRLGYGTEPLLKAAGISRSALDDPDGRVSCNAVSILFAAAMQEKPLTHLGARLAAATPFGAFALVDYLAVTSENVADAFNELARYVRLTEAPYSLELKPDDNPVRVVYYPGNAFTAEFGITLTVLRFREEMGGDFRAQSVHFTHVLEDSSVIQALIGCGVFGGSSWNGLEVDRQTWNRPMQRRDAALRGVLEQHARNIEARIANTAPLAREVRQVIGSRISKGEMQIEDVARALATSKRSLQRRLAEAGFSYQALLDDTRRDAAAEYLADATVSVAEVGYLLGYSEPAAFHRAFRRWNGTTPQEFRTRQRARSQPA